MGVISFGDDRPVWGASWNFMSGLVEKAIELYDRKDYLLHLNYMMAFGYNHLDMAELHVDELQEFLSVIPSYRARYLGLPDLSDAARDSAAKLLDELTAMMEDYIADRIGRGELTVERDLWTLRAAAESARAGSVRHRWTSPIRKFTCWNWRNAPKSACTR